MPAPMKFKASFNINKLTQASNQLNIKDKSENPINEIIENIAHDYNEDGQLLFSTNNNKKKECIEAIDAALYKLNDLDQPISSADGSNIHTEYNKEYIQSFKDAITLCSYLERDRAKNQGGNKFTAFIKVVRHTFEAHLALVEGKDIDKVETEFKNKLESIDNTIWNKIKSIINTEPKKSFFGGAAAGAIIDGGVKAGVTFLAGSTIIHKTLAIIGLIVAGLATVGIQGLLAVGAIYTLPVIGTGLIVGGIAKGIRYSREKSALNKLKPEVEKARNVKKQEQLEYLNQHLDEPTKECFSQYLTPSNIKVNTTSQLQKINTLVAGDLDGSTGRMTLLGIQAGKITASPKALRQLALVLKKEQEVLTALAESNKLTGWNRKGAIEKALEGFQSSEEISDLFDNIFNNIIFHPSQTKLVFIGDCIHDRLSCNKVVDTQIREKLVEQAAHFIFGNHDSYEEIVDSDPNQVDVQFGAYAYKTEPIKSKDYWIEHEKKCFKNAYYDKDSKTLYIHNGIRIIDDALKEKLGTSAEFRTAFGDINARSIDEFVEQVNLKTYSPPSAVHRDPSKKFPSFTSFRPDDEEYKKLVIGTIFEDITIVHGHEATHNIENAINEQNRLLLINLNSREAIDEKDIIKPVAANLI